VALSPNAKRDFREQIADFCSTAEAYEVRWSYSQRRPYSGLGVGPANWHTNDCSSYCDLVFWWAGHYSKHPVAAPLGYHYSGYGNTQSAYNFLKAHNAPVDKYRIGDLAIYGTPSLTKHMTVCRREGDRSQAVWSSFGRQEGPEPHALHYRSDLVGVYRHPALL
jgi:hypothetical protein